MDCLWEEAEFILKLERRAFSQAKCPPPPSSLSLCDLAVAVLAVPSARFLAANRVLLGSAVDHARQGQQLPGPRRWHQTGQRPAQGPARGGGPRCGGSPGACGAEPAGVVNPGAKARC